VTTTAGDRNDGDKGGESPPVGRLSSTVSIGWSRRTGGMWSLASRRIKIASGRGRSEREARAVVRAAVEEASVLETDPCPVPTLAGRLNEDLDFEIADLAGTPVGTPNIDLLAPQDLIPASDECPQRLRPAVGFESLSGETGDVEERKLPASIPDHRPPARNWRRQGTPVGKPDRARPRARRRRAPAGDGDRLRLRVADSPFTRKARRTKSIMLACIMPSSIVWPP
jgi:hypothetical protein